jgi:hypothetical protein
MRLIDADAITEEERRIYGFGNDCDLQQLLDAQPTIEGKGVKSRAEELERMCETINKNGGMDSEDWTTALLAQIALNLAIITDTLSTLAKKDGATDCPWK